MCQIEPFDEGSGGEEGVGESGVEGLPVRQ